VVGENDNKYFIEAGPYSLKDPSTGEYVYKWSRVGPNKKVT